MTRAPRRWIYPVLFTLWGCLPLYRVHALLGDGALSSPAAAALVAFTSVWWLAAAGLVLGQGWAEIAAPILGAVPLTLGLAQWVRRLLFVFVHGGLEAATGVGSPLAFLLGWAGEAVLVVVPGLVLTGLGFAAWSRTDGGRSSPDEASVRLAVREAAPRHRRPE